MNLAILTSEENGAGRGGYIDEPANVLELLPPSHSIVLKGEDDEFRHKFNSIVIHVSP